ncbi:MAG TPA: toll/interleukin-1 receptor domain-containing protein [Bryobacteraceae bacterium]|jgi:hypothetical protein|nr:toll/interleukin-1 receptor domain-containing protein [Bryobacteraceae bacterium]
MSLPQRQLSEATASVERPVYSLPHRSIWRRIADYFFGFDFFISYTSRDGAGYAFHLSEALGKCGFDCFLDADGFTKGDDWKAVGSAAIRRTSQLVLVGSPRVFESAPVVHEVQVFTATGRKVIPIDFGGTLADEKLRDTLLIEFITPEMLRIEEPLTALTEGPSKTTVTDLQNSFVHRRQSSKRLAAMKGIAAALAFLLALSIWFWRSAERQRGQADLARQDAVGKCKEADAAKKVAEEQRNAATIRQLIAVSNQIRLEEPQRMELAVLLAAESVRLTAAGEGNHRTVWPEAGNALRESLGRVLFPVRSPAFRSLVRPAVIEPKKGWLAECGRSAALAL